MGLLSFIVAKGVSTAAKKATIHAVEDAAVNVITAKAQANAMKEDAIVKNGIMYIKPTRSSDEYINENVEDVVKELLGVGFDSVVIRGVRKIGERSIKKYGRVLSVSINGKKEFLGIKKVPASSNIIIEFQDFKNDVDPNVYAGVKRFKNGKIFDITELGDTLELENTVIEDSKRFCVYCGKLISNKEARFCSFCGKEI